MSAGQRLSSGHLLGVIGVVSLCVASFLFGSLSAGGTGLERGVEKGLREGLRSGLDEALTPAAVEDRAAAAGRGVVAGALDAAVEGADEGRVLRAGGSLARDAVREADAAAAALLRGLREALPPPPGAGRTFRGGSAAGTPRFAGAGEAGTHDPRQDELRGDEAEGRRGGVPAREPRRGRRGAPGDDPAGLAEVAGSALDLGLGSLDVLLGVPRRERDAGAVAGEAGSEEPAKARQDEPVRGGGGAPRTGLGEASEEDPSAGTERAPAFHAAESRSAESLSGKVGAPAKGPADATEKR
ncbi:MAG: hypothetical protein D6731_24670 [Planctomycetota bacterium]|nr:MAG: hypothetical protein D6731_24670 [Planctomycetota bacterium]